MTCFIHLFQSKFSINYEILFSDPSGHKQYGGKWTKPKLVKVQTAALIKVHIMSREIRARRAQSLVSENKFEILVFYKRPSPVPVKIRDFQKDNSQVFAFFTCELILPYSRPYPEYVMNSVILSTNYRVHKF